MTHSELCFVACRWLASINRKYLAALFRESHYLIGELHRWIPQPSRRQLLCADRTRSSDWRKIMNMYTFRHTLGMQVEYVIWADNEAEAG